MPSNANLPPAHQIMARVFDTPDKVRQLARCCGVSDNHAYKWLRDGGTGAPSDLDRLCRIIFLASTFGPDGMKGAGLIVHYVREFFDSLVELTVEPYQSEHERVIDSTEILREAAEAVEALSLGRPTPETVKELVELRDAAELAITRLSAHGRRGGATGAP
jgi:transcriptional regulator with XRE-family HTH domain